MSSEYFGEDFFDSVRSQIRENVANCAEVFKEEVKEEISIQGVPEDRRSLPGEYPRKETGDLYASVRVVGPTVENDVVVAQIGSDVSYASSLELAPASEGGRPWLSRKLREEEEKWANIITGAEA